MKKNRQAYKFYFILILFLSVGNVSYSQLDTLFWFVAPEITQNHGDRPIVFRFATLDKAATISVSQPANPNFPSQIIQIAPNASQSLDLTPWIDIVENKPADFVLNYGFKISSNVPITCYYEVVTSCNCNPDIFTLKGKNSIGYSFITPFQNFLDNASYARSGFNIVATEDNTSITITPTNDIVGHNANIPFTIVLNKGQTYFAEAVGTASGSHLSGSWIVANKKIAVTLHDDTLSGAPYGGCGDLMGDQLIPIPVLGKEYIAIKGYLNGPDKVYIVAINDNTQISIDGTNVASLTKGSMYVHTLNNPTAYILASDSICVLHQSGFGCEVGEAVLPHIVCTGSNLIPFVRSTNEFIAMNILVPAGAEDGFTFNGQNGVVNANSFKYVPATNNTWMYAQLDISSNIAVQQGARVENSKSKFHMGIIHGGSSSGCRYGYFSDFGSLKYEIKTDKASLCEGDTLKLVSSNFLNATYDWKGPNNFTFKGSNLVLNPCTLAHAGMYKISGFKTNTCYIAPDSITIKIFKNDSIVKKENRIICSSELPLQWYGQALKQAGTYKTKVLNPSKCIDTIIYLNLSVNLIKAGSDLKICQGESVKLNATGGVSYQWDNNVVNGVLFSPPKSARYTVTATDVNGCKDTSSLFILVNPLPTVNAGNDTNVCEGSPVILKAKGAFTYSWNKGVENAKAFYPNASAMYEVLGTDINGCKNSDQVTVNLNSNPAFTPNVNEPCTKSTLQFTVELDSKTSFIGLKKATWTGPNGFSSNESNASIPNVTTSHKGNYSIEIIDNNNCKSTKNILVSILPEDSIVFQNVEEKCVNSPSFKLPWTNIPGGTWTSNDNTSIINSVDGIFDPAKSKPNQNNLVEVSYATNSILPARKCPSKATMQIVIKPIPDSTFSVVNPLVCEEDVVEFKINKPNVNATYYWDFGDGINANGLDPKHTYKKVGFMDVKLLSFLDKCHVSSTRKALVNVISKPTQVDFTQNVSEIDYYYPVVEFSTNTIAKYYAWHFGDYQTSKLKNPSHTFPTIPGEYTIKLQVFNMENHCDASVEHKILLPEPTIYFVPNSFTPNSDEVNNVFLPIITSGFDSQKYSLYIFNRWGALVFESHDANVGWDGTFGNALLPSDTYIWKLEFTEKMTDKRHAKEGVVNLIR